MTPPGPPGRHRRRRRIRRRRDSPPDRAVAAGTRGQAALHEAGLAEDTAFDAVVHAVPWSCAPTMTLAEYLGIQPRYTDSTNIGGRPSRRTRATPPRPSRPA